MHIGLILSIALGFAVGLALAIIRVRRQVKAQVREQMVLIGQERLKQELVKRISGEAAAQMAEQARQEQEATHSSEDQAQK